MSQKKAFRNRMAKLNRELASGVIGEDFSKFALTHALWAKPTEQTRAKFTDAGPWLTLKVIGSLGAPELTMKFALRDALMILDEERDDDMIDFVADRYHELTDPLFPDDKILSLAIDRKDGSGSEVILELRPEHYNYDQDL